MASLDKIDMLSKKIASQCKKQGELLEQITKSRAIQRLWPDAFKHGKVKAYWTGELTTTQEYMRMKAQGRKGKAQRFTIINGQGEQRQFAPSQVPEILNCNNLYIGD